ncbi:leupaxin [Aplochiton taeniatus]
MDELDILLEELALNSGRTDTFAQTRESVKAAAKGSKPNHIDLSPKTGKDSPSSNAYSELPPPVEAMSPNSATRELDSIMQELMGLGKGLPEDPPLAATPPPVTQKQSVNMKRDDGEGKRESDRTLPCPNVEGSTRSKKADAIDALLGGLSSDLEKIGVCTTAKGHCATCGKIIGGKMITALGKVWHPEHFVCTACQTELGTAGFFEREGMAYCEKDYQELFCPRCAYCKGPIVQNILTAMDHTWHPEHFFCAHCGERFGPEGFLEKDGKPYCQRDFYHLYAPKCSGCGEAVTENYLSAANGTWHPDCFVCSDCLKPFTDSCFMELEGRPLCSLHFHTRQGTLCGGCGDPISGRCISALDRKFHPEHFVCAFCLHKLNQGIFKEQNGKPYCAVCHTKLFV